MSNCPKCGNPIQPGVTSCSICGTNLQGGGEQKNVSKTVASVAAPVQSAQQVNNPPTTQNANVAAPVQNVAPTPAPVSAPATPIAPIVTEPAPQQIQQTTVSKPVELATTVPVASSSSVQQSQPQVVSEVASSGQQVGTESVKAETVVEPQGVQEIASTPVVVVDTPVSNVEQQTEEKKNDVQVVAPIVSNEPFVPAPVVVDTGDGNDLVQAVEQAQQMQSNADGVGMPQTVVEEVIPQVVAPSVVESASIAPVVMPDVEVSQPSQTIVDANVGTFGTVVAPPAQVGPAESVSVNMQVPIQPPQPPLVSSEPGFSSGPLDGNVMAPSSTLASGNGVVPPIPSIPSSLSNMSVTMTPTPESTDKNVGKKKKEKKVKEPKGKTGFNKNFVLVGLIALIFVGVGGFLFMNTNKGVSKNNKNAPAAQLDGGMVTSNGYKFSLAKGWIVTEGNGNVIITNATDDSTVQVKLSNSTASIDSLNDEVIGNYLKVNDKIVDPKIEKLEISAKKTYLLSASFNSLPVQFYFIGGGSRLIIGATVVYSSDDSKAKYEATVQEIIATISYSDDSVKALDMLEMYSNIFSVYNGIITYAQNPSSFASNVDYGNEPVEIDNTNNGDNISTEDNQSSSDETSGEENTNVPEANVPGEGN